MLDYCSGHDIVKHVLAEGSQALFLNAAAGQLVGKLPFQHTVWKLNFAPRFVLLIWHKNMHFYFPSPLQAYWWWWKHQLHFAFLHIFLLLLNIGTQMGYCHLFSFKHQNTGDLSGYQIFSWYLTVFEKAWHGLLKEKDDQDRIQRPLSGL